MALNNHLINVICLLGNIIQMSGEESLVKGSIAANACELHAASQRCCSLQSPAGTRRGRPVRSGPHAGPWKGVIEGMGHLEEGKGCREDNLASASDLTMENPHFISQFSKPEIILFSQRDKVTTTETFLKKENALIILHIDYIFIPPSSFENIFCMVIVNSYNTTSYLYFILTYYQKHFKV